MKERLKTFILIFLVLGSLALTLNTWTKERLWPEGYNLFTTVKNWSVIRMLFSEEKYSEPLENLSRARKVVVADGEGSTAVYYNTDTAFNDVYDDIKSLFCSYLNGELTPGTETTLSKDDLRTILNGQICYAYINYPITYTPQLFGQVMDVPFSQGFSGLNAAKDFFIIPTSDTQLSLLAVDSANGNILRYELTYEHAAALSAQLKSSAVNADPAHNCMLALELNMDLQNTEDIIKTPVLLDSFVVLDTASTANVVNRRINSTNPLANEVGELSDSPVLDEVVRLFSYNPQSIHSYVDSSGTIIYLENSSTLKIYKNGLISYNALNPERGISIIESGSAPSLYESLNAAISFTESIWAAAMPDKPFNASVSSDLLEPSGSGYRFTFDYYFEGIPVVTKLSGTDGSLNHAVELTVSNGIITSFNMLLRDYESTDSSVDNMTIYQALDRLIVSYASDAAAADAVYVDDIFLCYAEDGVIQTKDTVWAADIDGENVLIGS